MGCGSCLNLVSKDVQKYTENAELESFKQIDAENGRLANQIAGK